MTIGIKLNINLSLIDKERLFKNDKGTHLNITTFVNQNQLDKFGRSHGFNTQSISKEENDAGVRLPILGNTEIFWSDDIDFVPREKQKPLTQEQYAEDTSPTASQSANQVKNSNDYLNNDWDKKGRTLPGENEDIEF